MARFSFFKCVSKVFGSLAIIIPVLALSGCGEGDGPTGIKNVAVPPLDLPAGFCDPINFEIECEPPAIIWFGGGQTIVVNNVEEVADPNTEVNLPDPTGINSSDRFGRMQKFGDQPFGGTRLNPVEVPVDFAAGQVFKMKVWSEREVPVTFKLEETNDGTGGVEKVATHGGGSVWEELCFDFTTGIPANPTIGLTIIFDNNVLGAAIGGVFSGDWTFYYDDITQVERCSDAPLTGIVPDVSLYDPAGDPRVPADVEVTAFDSQSVIDQVYAVDETYMPVLAVSSGVGYGANIAQIGFTGGDRGFLSEFESLDFKVKGMPNNVIFVKLFDGVDSLRINLTSSAYADELTGGWYQVSIPVSAFNGVSLATGIVFESDATAPMQFTMLLTDVGFTEVDDNGGGTDPGGSVVPDASILEADGSAADLTAVFTGFDSGTGTEIVADSTYAQALEVTVADAYAPGALNLAQLFITELSSLDSYDEFVFKVKGLTDNNLVMKIEPPAGGTSVAIDLSAPGAGITAEALSDGWTQVVVSLAQFGDLSSATLVILQTLDNAYALGDTFLLTDIGFNAPGGGAPTGGSVPDATILEADGSAADLTAVFTGFDSGTGTEIVADSTYAQALEVTVADAYAPGALNLAQLFITELSSLDSYDEFLFKVKGLTDNNLVMKVEPPAGGTSVAIDLSAPGAGITVETLSDGWSQVVVSLAQFGDLSSATLVILQTLDNAYALGDTFLLTDIGFNTPVGGDSGSGDCVRGPGPELATNGDIEAGDLTCFDVFTDFGGVATADNTQNHTDGGTWSIHAVSNGNRASTVIKQSFLAPGTVVNGDTIDVSFWMKGTAAAGGVINPKVIAEGAGDAAVGFELVPNIPVPGADWTLHSYSQLVNADVTRGVTFEIAVVCADIAECTADVFIDDISVTIQ